MSTTYKQANDQILFLFHEAWNPRLAIYENTPGVKPEGTADWARVVLRHLTGGQASLANESGKSRWEREGLLTVQIFTTLGLGLSHAYDLSKVVTGAYQKVKIPGEVWYRNMRVNEIGPDGEWFQVNVLIEFNYDEVE